MKSVYIIMCFDKETHKYKGTLNAVFETRDLAKGYASACNNIMAYVIREVEFYKSYETK